MYVVMAYRWGGTNLHSYIVGLFEGEREAVLRAKEEHQDRAGKYGIAVYNQELCMVHYEKSRRDEYAPHIDGTEVAARSLGRFVLSMKNIPGEIKLLTDKVSLARDVQAAFRYQEG